MSDEMMYCMQWILVYLRRVYKVQSPAESHGFQAMAGIDSTRLRFLSFLASFCEEESAGVSAGVV